MTADPLLAADAIVAAAAIFASQWFPAINGSGGGGDRDGDGGGRATSAIARPPMADPALDDIPVHTSYDRFWVKAAELTIEQNLRPTYHRINEIASRVRQGRIWPTLVEFELG